MALTRGLKHERNGTASSKWKHSQSNQPGQCRNQFQLPQVSAAFAVAALRDEIQPAPLKRRRAPRWKTRYVNNMMFGNRKQICEPDYAQLLPPDPSAPFAIYDWHRPRAPDEHDLSVSIRRRGCALARDSCSLSRRQSPQRQKS